MRPDLDPHDVEAIIKRHDELTRQTYERYGVRGAANDEEIFKPGVYFACGLASRIAALFIVAIVALGALALAISGLPGASK